MESLLEDEVRPVVDYVMMDYADRRPVLEIIGFGIEYGPPLG